MRRLRNAATPTLHAPQLLPYPCSFILANFSTPDAGCCTYGQDGCTTCLRHFSAISRVRDLNQDAQTLSSPFLLLFVLVSEALQVPACQKSENRMDRG